MTTVAFDGRYLASDGRACTSQGMIVGREEQKIYPMKVVLDGEPTDVVLGISGCVTTISSLLRWLERGGDLLNNEERFSLFDLNPDPEAASIGIIMVVKGGDTFLVSEELSPFEAETPLGAGSGTPFCVTAMSCGMNAVQSVYKSIEFDSNSGGKVRAFDTEAWAWIEPGDVR